MMQIDIQARHFSLTQALREHTERRIGYALTSFDEYILRIIVRLSDINGPRGGKDKHCHLQVVLSGLPDVVIEDTEADMYVAIDRAVSRAGRSVVRKLKRQKARQTYTRQAIFEPEDYLQLQDQRLAGGVL